MTIIYDEPNHIYHANQAVSSSEAKLAHQSLQLFLDNRNGLVKRPESPAMATGSAIHAYFLEPDTWEELYAVKPDDLDGRTKEGKAWKEANSNRTIISSDDLLAIRMLHERAPEHILELFAGSQNEVTVRCTLTCGLDVQCRFDSLFEESIAYDLKTTSRFDDFEKQVSSLRYDLSAGWYNMVYGNERSPFPGLDQWSWVVAETVAPWRWAIVHFDNDHLSIVTENCMYLAESIKKALDNPASVKETRCPTSVWQPPAWHQW